MQHIQPNLVFMKYSILDHWQKYSIHLEANSEILKHKKCLYRASLGKRVKIIKNAKVAENISQNYLLLEIHTILKKKTYFPLSTPLQICDWSGTTTPPPSPLVNPFYFLLYIKLNLFYSHFLKYFSHLIKQNSFIREFGN